VDPTTKARAETVFSLTVWKSFSESLEVVEESDSVSEDLSTVADSVERADNREEIDEPASTSKKR
jgi:hypothetical protein